MTFAEELELEAFPFDVQDFTISIVVPNPESYDTPGDMNISFFSEPLPSRISSLTD